MEGDITMSKVEHVIAVNNKAGEGPIWDSREQALYWVDIYTPNVYRFYPAAGKYESLRVALPITALALRASGGMVVATGFGFAFWDPCTQELDFIANPEADRPCIRFNDGSIDPYGRFWAGTMNEEHPESSDGCLYRLDPDGSVHRMATGFTVSNGIGWSPDNQTMYFTDSLRRIILAYDYDSPSGAITNRRPLVHVPEEEGFPDGLAVDREGFVWSAHWGGCKVRRYDPTGKAEREILLPVQNVSSCAFGGENLDELYITTAWQGLSEKERKGQPFAGDLFRVKVDVRGKEKSRFGG
jgi:sugar lactone lactonase YvrE